MNLIFTNTLRQLAPIRRACIRMLDALGPRVVESSNDGLDMETMGDRDLVLRMRLRRGQIRYVAVDPRREPELFDKLITLRFVFAAIEHIRADLERLSATEEIGRDCKAFDEIGWRLILCGSNVAKLGIRLSHSRKSTPNTTREKLTDPAIKALARAELERQLRGKVSWSAACTRAAAKLMQVHGVEIDGKTLGKKFPDLGKDAKRPKRKSGR